MPSDYRQTTTTPHHPIVKDFFETFTKRSRKQPSMVTIHYHKHDCTCFHKNFPGANARTHRHTAPGDFSHADLSKSLPHTNPYTGHLSFLQIQSGFKNILSHSSHGLELSFCLFIFCRNFNQNILFHCKLKVNHSCKYYLAMYGLTRNV